MIEFEFNTEFELLHQDKLTAWIETVVEQLGFELGDIMYQFCDDDQVHQLNVEFLNHDTLTDILSFDYSIGKQIHGEIFISVDRVRDNAQIFNVTFEDELHRVMIHGILHYCGIRDESEIEALEMREKEDWALSLLAID